MHALIVACWSPDPRSRPKSFGVVVGLLEGIWRSFHGVEASLAREDESCGLGPGPGEGADAEAGGGENNVVTWAASADASRRGAGGGTVGLPAMEI